MKGDGHMERNLVTEEEFWKVFDKKWDGQIHRVPVRLLKPVESYDVLLGGTANHTWNPL